MTELTFVDSNILVYSLDATETFKQPIAAEWLERLWKERRGALSVQVLEEFYHVVTHKLSPGLPVSEAREVVRELGAWQPLALTPGVIEGAWRVQDLSSVSFWDAMIVSAARELGATTILSEDLADGQSFAGVRVLNPFAAR